RNAVRAAEGHRRRPGRSSVQASWSPPPQQSWRPSEYVEGRHADPPESHTSDQPTHHVRDRLISTGTEFASIRNGLTRVLGSGDERPSRLAATATVRDIGHRVAARTTPAFRRALPTLELVLRLFAEVLGLAFGLIGLALTFQPLVAGSVAGRLLHFALGALYVVLGSVGGCHV